MNCPFCHFFPNFCLLELKFSMSGDLNNRCISEVGCSIVKNAKPFILESCSQEIQLFENAYIKNKVNPHKVGPRSWNVCPSFLFPHGAC